MEWKWSKANEKDLARFVNEKAIQLLDKLPINDRLKLVQDESGRRTLVKTIYETLVTRGIRYDFEKYQPEAETQLIRTPVEILSTPGEGTCLDLALLFCSLCFGYDLLPLLIVIEGHAFAAVSLKHKREEWNAYGTERAMFDTSILFQGDTNLAELKRLVEDEAYIAVECTGFAHSQVLGNAQAPEAKGRTSDGTLSFGRAVKAGSEQLENADRKFKFAIDIAAAKYIWKIQTEEIPDLEEHVSKISKMYGKQDLEDINRVIAVVNENESDGLIDMESYQNVKNATDSVIKGNVNKGKGNSGTSKTRQDLGEIERTHVVAEEHNEL